MRYNHKSRLAGALLLVGLCLQGCSSALGVWPVTQSHFTDQDVKIVSLGPVKGTAGDWIFTFGGLADIMHPDISQEAVLEALREKKADLLTDYTLSLRGTRVPIFLIPGLDFWWISWTAEGVAAKIEVVKPVPLAEPGKGPKSEAR